MRGGDGFAVVIQNCSPTSLGTLGSGLGYAAAHDDAAGIPDSLAIEFDTLSLSEYGATPGTFFGDPNSNHISVHSRGPEPNHADEAYSLGNATQGLPNFKDGNLHSVTISYTPGSLRVSVDCAEKPALTVALRLDSFSGKGFTDASVLDKTGKAWVGFTAATGGLIETHDILSWKLEPARLAAR
jgi:hypothetical protein